MSKYRVSGGFRTRWRILHIRGWTDALRRWFSWEALESFAEVTFDEQPGKDYARLCPHNARERMDNDAYDFCTDCHHPVAK